ncbi:hypothetical protein KY317_03645, partial [Candidatus Woesearchaeota archaeon]|nr:hypothetical protein [Candidatus Woesearchaeota archaeon]
RKKKKTNNNEEFSDKEPYTEEDKRPEEREKDMDMGKTDEDVYTEEGREKLVEDGEISPEEEGFMEGAEQKGEQAKCAYCGKVLGEDEKNIYERKFDGEIKWFCSEEHAKKYAEKDWVRIIPKKPRKSKYSK